jgi:ribosomal protein L1
MPNPKTGTVTMDKCCVQEVAGKIDFKVDKTGIVLQEWFFWSRNC